MKSYVALIRGILPTNPNMRNDKLRGAFEAIGFRNVRTVISSRNVLFEADESDTDALEAQIDQALPELLGFPNTSIVRSQGQLQELVDRDPFEGLDHTHQTNLTVTFAKITPRTDLKFPYKGEGYVITHIRGREVYSVLDLTTGKTPALMSWLERQFGKDITTRTYKTVGRILKKLGEPKK
jgi:uncharacterized protein (DUF1697 family)